MLKTYLKPTLLIPCLKPTPEAMHTPLYLHKGPVCLSCCLLNEDVFRKLKGESLYSGDKGSKRSLKNWLALDSAFADLEPIN